MNDANVAAVTRIVSARQIKAPPRLKRVAFQTSRLLDSSGSAN
jgi:hypothetical protein